MSWVVFSYSLPSKAASSARGGVATVTAIGRHLPGRGDSCPSRTG